MWADVLGRADLLMPQALGYGYGIDTLINQDACLGMAELMRVDVREIIFLGKLAEPVLDTVRVHRFSIRLGKAVVPINPLVTQFESLDHLLLLVKGKELHHAGIDGKLTAPSVLEVSS